MYGRMEAARARGCLLRYVMGLYGEGLSRSLAVRGNWRLEYISKDLDIRTGSQSSRDSFESERFILLERVTSLKIHFQAL